MNNPPKIYEDKLHSAWQSQSFTKKLKTLTGDEITVLDAGSKNEDTAGPDFKNARIRIGNLIYVGDIEIDCEYEHWKLHGHNIDSKHNKVILHASLINKQNQHYVYTKDGRRVPTICLSRFLESDFHYKYSQDATVKNKLNNNCNLKCSFAADKLEYDIKRKFVSKLGIERFKKKCERVFARLKEITYLHQLSIHEPVIKYDMRSDFDNREFKPQDFKDKIIWQQLFYEMIFEALGYSKNKSIMLSLAQAVNFNVFTKLGNDGEFVERVESLLFNASGLMPDVSNLPESEYSIYTKRLAENWENLSRIYDGQTFNEADWHFFKLRPQNFPTVRLAGGVRIIDAIIHKNLIETIIKRFEDVNNLEVLIRILRSSFVIKSDGYWRNHYIFDQPSKEGVKYFIGVSRADELVINVILPVFSVYFDIFGKEELSRKCLKIYNIYQQKSDNKIIREVAECLKTPEFLKKTMLSQGMLELFRNYCSKQRCLECEIGKIVFN
ncbi:MAG: DUF2851 family protein [Bacteroidetes bacterium]|nr:DUF2851 family protein [Bacteroidota bacterium]